MRRFASLRRRGDFARLRARGRRTPTANFSIYQADPGARDLQPLVGITISKTVGGAVVRNRLRRRIAAIVQEVFLAGKPQMRILIVARPAAAALDFPTLRTELTKALA
jgi:ribonuclease P protein component